MLSSIALSAAQIDRLGKPRPIDSSKIINPTFNLSGAQP